jgi:hypothetical protein
MAKKTCFECGYLTIHGRELDRSDRIELYSISAQGSSASLPADSNHTRCCKGLWDSDLDGSVDSRTLHDELRRDRKSCAYFAKYEPTFNPNGHQERQDEKRKESLQLKIALLGFSGGLLGSIVGQILWFLFSRRLR